MSLPRDSKRGPDVGTRTLAERLVRDANLGPVQHMETFVPPTTNPHCLVHTRAGRVFVLRRYRAQPPPHTALARLRRERWVHETLIAAGAPVPLILATNEDLGEEAALMEVAAGRSLGFLAARLPSKRAEGAWAAAGRALASVHSVGESEAIAAGCEGVGIRRPSRRGSSHLDATLKTLYELAELRPELRALERLAEIVEGALPLYERARASLVQHDCHLWQFFLEQRGRRWTCTAILDWEHADLDDPDWDVAQLDGFRFEDVGLTPGAFFKGYGPRPTGPLSTLYRLERAAWLLEARERGVRWVELSCGLAETFVSRLLAEPEVLRRQIEDRLERSS